MKAKALTIIAVIAVILAGASLVVSSDADEGFTAEYMVIDENYVVKGTAAVEFSDKLTYRGVVSDSTGNKLVEKTAGIQGNAVAITWKGTPLENGTYTFKIFDIPGQTIFYTCTFQVGDTPVEPKIKSIKAEATETTYYVGQSFDASKMTVTATYDDGNTAPLAADAYTYAPDDELTLENKEIIVTLKDDATIYDIIEIEVKEKTIFATVTFVISEGYTKAVTTVVGEPVDKPADPVVEGVDFIGWFLADATEPFNFDTPIAGETTLYAHCGPKALPPTQTEKFIASVTEDCTIVITAYDGKIIGKATAKVQLYKETDIGGTMMYVAVKDAVVPVDIDSKDIFFVKNVANDVKGLITEPGNYAVMAQISLNGITQTTNYVTIDNSEQA